MQAWELWKGMCVSTSASIKSCIAVDRQLVRDWDTHLLCENQLTNVDTLKQHGKHDEHLELDVPWGLAAVST